MNLGKSGPCNIIEDLSLVFRGRGFLSRWRVHITISNPIRSFLTRCVPKRRRDIRKGLNTRRVGKVLLHYLFSYKYILNHFRPLGFMGLEVNYFYII